MSDRSYREATSAALLGLTVNGLLGTAKLVGGIFGNSFALLADAVNSLGDVVTSLAILVALRVAQRPPDTNHPYGHMRAESIAACNVSLLVVLSALLVGWEAIVRLPVQHPIPPRWTLWIAAINVVVKESLYHYKMRVGRRTGSTALRAAAWDHRSDALSAFAVLVGLMTIRFGGERLLWADEIGSLVVVGIIVVSGFRLFRESASELMDVQADGSLVESIRSCAEQVDNVMQIETLRVRKAGLEYLVDIHVQVLPTMSVAEGHAVGHSVKDRLLHAFPAIRDVLVHLEPAASAGSSTG
ncbi:MAG: cation transporter [Bdellovibrionales bacterium]|nr:cation transporter [Bdellovibrionales bacterium]